MAGPSAEPTPCLEAPRPGEPAELAALRAELAAVRAREALLRQVLEHSRDAVNMLDLATGRYVYLSPAQVALTGFTEAELRAMPAAEALERVHPDDRHVSDEQQRAVAEGREGDLSVEYRWRVKGGEYRWFSDRRRLVRDAAGRAVALVGVSRDVTEERAAAEALRRREALARRQAAELEAVLDTVPACVWITRDPRGEHIEGNRFGHELLRRPKGENLSAAEPAREGLQAFRVLMDGAPVPAESLPIQLAARTGRELRGAETEVHFEDGTARYLLGNATPILDEAGRPAGSVGAFIDITERKLAERALREADRRKGDFLAVLSHELRNPLAPIRNSIFLLEAAPAGGEVAARALEVLRRQADHLARLVDDLLDVTRITHGRVELRRARLDVREVVRRAWTDARGLYERRGVDLLLSESGAPLWVEADAARLAQLLGNLLANALKFTPPCGRVRVGVERRGDRCELSVADSGAGVAAEDLERIFEPFVQSSRNAPASGGLGIGLALVRELAVRHGGRAWAESEGPGRGARFLVELPLAAPPAPPPPAAGEGEAVRSLAVLVVEDNEDAAATLADLLGFLGHRPVTAATGAAGIAAAAASPPDVLICDVGLPDRSGHEVIRAVRQGPGGDRIYALALTGFAQPEDREAALAAGFDAHLPKPPPIAQLRQLLASAAEAGRQRRAERPVGG